MRMAPGSPVRPSGDVMRTDRAGRRVGGVDSCGNHADDQREHCSRSARLKPGTTYADTRTSRCSSRVHRRGLLVGDEVAVARRSRSSGVSRRGSPRYSASESA